MDFIEFSSEATRLDRAVQWLKRTSGGRINRVKKDRNIRKNRKDQTEKTKNLQGIENANQPTKKSNKRFSIKRFLKQK